MPGLAHSIESERYVVGGLLFAGSRALSLCQSVVDCGDFYHPAHSVIYRAAKDLDAAGTPIDLVSVGSHLRVIGEAGKLSALDPPGDAYLVDLSASFPSLDGIVHHARVVRDKSRLRRLALACSAIVERSAREGADLQELIEQAQTAVFALSKREDRPRQWVGQAADHEIACLTDLAKRRSFLTGVSTGFWRLDDVTSGLQPEDLVIIAARPSMGKTALVLDLLLNAAQRGFPGLLFSLEMSTSSLSQRSIARASGVGLHVLRRGLRSDALAQVQHSSPRLRQLPVEIVDWPSPSLAAIRAEARAWRLWWAENSRQRGVEIPLGIVAVDYLQLIGGTGAGAPRRGYDSREREISEISRGLKALAKELRIPVVALSQLNRAVESRPKNDRRPRLSDLRESGAIEQDADLICFIYRDEVYNQKSQDKGIAEVIIAKQRQGEIGTVRLGFSGALSRFTDLDAPPPQEEMNFGQ